MAMAAVNGCRRSTNQPFTLSARRWYSAAAASTPLPLEGYRVLDMTRVLAGVSEILFFVLFVHGEN